ALIRGPPAQASTVHHPLRGGHGSSAGWTKPRGSPVCCLWRFNPQETAPHDPPALPRTPQTVPPSPRQPFFGALAVTFRAPPQQLRVVDCTAIPSQGALLLVPNRDQRPGSGDRRL